MSSTECTRAWQAEAAEDGRLSKADLASFERHAATCAACQREIAAFSELKRLGRELPVLASTPLERRRLRNELLRRAHGDHQRAPRRAPAWLLAGALALAAAAGVAFLLMPRATDPPPAAGAAPSREPTYRAIASNDTAWSTHQPGRDLRLALHRGRLELAVDPLRADQRFIVELPDGELEVKGTRFVIEADGIRTLGVRVLEGRVVLRLLDREPASLAAGDAYAAPSSRAAPPPIDAAAPEETATTPRSASKRERTARAGARAASVPEAAGAAATVPNASAFSRAMAAFSAGDYGRSDELFADFEREHPQDARVEDALFLRAVARSRRGDASGARGIARQYLERFPNGLRRDDAERLAR